MFWHFDKYLQNITFLQTISFPNLLKYQIENNVRVCFLVHSVISNEHNILLLDARFIDRCVKWSMIEVFLYLRFILIS